MHTNVCHINIYKLNKEFEENNLYQYHYEYLIFILNRNLI